ncbi:unnamed protein product [Coregonus sp. 'balchen']|nr:unnamed protein product [Coregonus sp. 'balchen']
MTSEAIFKGERSRAPGTLPWNGRVYAAAWDSSQHCRSRFYISVMRQYTTSRAMASRGASCVACCHVCVFAFTAFLIVAERTAHGSYYWDRERERGRAGEWRGKERQIWRERAPHRSFGTMCVQFGTMCVQFGTMCVQFGTMCVQFGTMCFQFGARCVQFGTRCVQFGTRCVQFGTRCVQFGTRCVQFGTMCVQFGTMCVQFGTMCVQFGARCVQFGTRCVQFGTRCVQFGTMCVQFDTMCVQFGTMCVQFGTMCDQFGASFLNVDLSTKQCPLLSHYFYVNTSCHYTTKYGLCVMSCIISNDLRVCVCVCVCV